MSAFLAAALRFWRAPATRAVLGPLLYLGSVNGIFWILARAVEAVVAFFNDALWEELANLLALVYTFCLAILFSAIIFLSAAPGQGTTTLFWREALGFVLLYIALGAAYMDRSTGQIIPYSRPGYFAGLVAYVVFAAFPRALDQPLLIRFHGLIEALARGGVGWFLSAVTVFEVCWGILRRGSGWILLILSPLLWRVGLQRHPMIRVRRRD